MWKFPARVWRTTNFQMASPGIKAGSEETRPVSCFLSRCSLLLGFWSQTQVTACWNQSHGAILTEIRSFLNNLDETDEIYNRKNGPKVPYLPFNLIIRYYLSGSSHFCFVLFCFELTCSWFQNTLRPLWNARANAEGEAKKGLERFPACVQAAAPLRCCQLSHNASEKNDVKSQRQPSWHCWKLAWVRDR